MRKLHNKTPGAITAALIMTVTVTLLAACQVGLGSAVDVQAPEIEIKTPQTSDVIRDDFAIGGAWSDDGEIKSLKVTIRNTETNKTIAEKDGEIERDEDPSTYKGTWRAVIRPVEEKIPDGSYEATVTIHDKGGHKTVTSRAFVIDNTAPVVVLQRPSTKAGDSGTDIFGQTLSLTGQAADDNNIHSIRVTFYSDEECTQEIHHVDLDNVPPTISLDVANFSEGENNDYAKIYGSTAKEPSNWKSA